VLAENFIQIAGIIDRAEAQMLQQCGVKYLGFPLRLAIHGEDITDECASRIFAQLKPPVFGVLITYLDKAQDIAELCTFLGAGIVQLHGDIEIAQLRKLKRMAPELLVIKSLVVGFDSPSVLESTVTALSESVDAFITDTYDSTTGATGATGRVHDWEISKRLVQHSDRPVILAGGLNPENVKRAILHVRPAGVDAHTGVEDTSGRKSRERVQSFVAEARAGFRLIADGMPG